MFMDFTNINDPAGVKALLDQLRQSQAWQESVAPSNSVDSAPAPQAEYRHDVSVPEQFQPAVNSTSVASLLSQLQASSSFTSVTNGTQAEPLTLGASPEHSGLQPLLGQDVPAPSRVAQVFPSSARKQDLRWLSFQQALPHLARLGEDPSCVSVIAQMRQEQADLEKQLYEERMAIYKKHEAKVRVAWTRANIVGGLSRHEADMMSDAFQKELRKFDLERALTAWDGLVSKQQAALEGLGVPGMFITDASADRERQQRIVQVLEGIAGGDG